VDPLEQLLELTRSHGDAEGNEAEVADLQDLCQALWRLLTKEQRDAFLASPEVGSLRECAANAGCEACGSADASGPAGLCDQCGRAFAVNGDGTANHLTDEGAIDHDRDADHVPYGEG
jgi:hypothetical protein